MRQNNITKKEFDLINGNYISVKQLEEKNLSFGMVATKNHLLIRRLTRKNEQTGFLFIHFIDGLYAYPLFKKDEYTMEIDKTYTVQFNRFIKDFLMHEENKNVDGSLKEDICYVLKEKYFCDEKNAC